MRKLVLFLNYFIIFFLVRKIYSSGNKDNFDIDIIEYKNCITFDTETWGKLINKLKCGSLSILSITAI